MVSNNRNNDNDDILHTDMIRLLKAYVQDECRGDSFFINISGCNSDLLSYIKESCISKLDDIHVVALAAARMDFSFESVVKLRNNESIKKILIFSNTSLQSIESLKDFTQIYQDNLNYDILWPHLEAMFLVDIISKFSRLSAILKVFIHDVTAEIHPALYELVSYLKACNQEFVDNEYDMKSVAFIFNSKLYLLGVWSSLSSTTLSRKVLKKIATNSLPSAIQKKLTAPRDIEKFDEENKGANPNLFKNRFPPVAKQKQLLDKMFYHREYAEAFEKIAFEQMEPILKHSSRKNTTEKDSLPEEPLYIFENIYHMYLYMLSGQGDIMVTDRQIFDAEQGITLTPDDYFEAESNDMEQVISYSYEQLGETQTNYISVDFKKAIDKVEQFKKIFTLAGFNNGQRILAKCENLNIPEIDKVSLENCLKIYLTQRQEYVQKLLPSNNAYFLRLHQLLEESLGVRKAFMELIKLLYDLDSTSIETLASVNFLSDILEIDFALDEEILFVPIYSPIILFYLQIVQNRYQELLPDCENLDINILETLETLNASVLNDCIPYRDALYQLSDSSIFPYHVCFENISHLDSIRHIDFRSISWPLIKFVQQFPYKHTLRLYICGKIDSQSVRTSLKNFLHSYYIKDSNLSKIHITIASQNQKNISDALFTLLQRDDSFDIECEIETIEDISSDELKRIVGENDIVLFLDSCILYREPTFIGGDQSILASNLRYRSFEMEKSALPVSGRNTPIVPHAINALLNAAVSGRLQEGEWNRHQLDMNLFGSINSALREQSRADRRIIIASSNPNLDEQIFDNENILAIYEDVVTGSEQNMKVLILDCASKRATSERSGFEHAYKDEYNPKSIRLLRSNLYRSLNINERIFSFGFSANWLDLFSVNYEDFPRGIAIIDRQYDEIANEDAQEEFDLVFNNYLKRAFLPKHHLDTLYKDMMIAALMREADTLSDIVFVHYFARLNCEKLSRINMKKAERIVTVECISSMDKNYLFRILKFLDAEELSERTSRDFLKFLATSKIDTDKLHQIIRIAQDANYSNKGYLVENLTKYLGGVQK